jgi:4-amino-4-deoxychorismate lyase
MDVIVNGEPDGCLDPGDRGLAFGDGVFRTLLIRNGRPMCWSRHYRKLRADCEALELPCPDSDTLATELLQAANGRQDGAARIIVTRGTGPRGYKTPTRREPSRIVSVSPLPVHPQAFRETGVRVHRCRLRLAIQPRLAGVKHLNRLENVLARMEWSEPDIAEGLLADAEARLTEGISSNLFIIRGGRLETPDLSRCGVSGVTRERVMEAALEERVPLRVAVLSWQDLLESDEAVLVNSLIGAWQIRSMGQHTWGSGIWAARIRGWLDVREA